MPNFLNFQASCEYFYIDKALKSLWQPFNDLVKEMDAFVPRPVTDYEPERREMLERLRSLNPEKSDELLLDQFVNPSIDCAASERVQFADQFSDHFMTQYIMVAFLSHALCEAVINAILAIGLAQTNSMDLFPILEKANVKEKWHFGPKSFLPTYELKCGTALSETLSHLIKRRNALVHYKIDLHVGDEVKLKGSKFERLSFQDNIKWMRRFFSLPYDLSAHASMQLRDFAIFVLHDSSPIIKAAEHETSNHSSKPTASSGD